MLQQESVLETALNKFMHDTATAASRHPDALRERIRDERLENMQRFATILCPSHSRDSGTDLFSALGEACVKIEEIQGLHRNLWAAIYYLNSNLKGAKADYATPLQEQLGMIIDQSTPASVQSALKAVFNAINFECFTARTPAELKHEWLKPENRENLLQILSDYLPEDVNLADVSASADRSLTRVNATAASQLPAVAVDKGKAPNLADAVMPHFNRQDPQIAIQVGGGLLFANAGEGQDLVISNKGGGEVSITLKPNG